MNCLYCNTPVEFYCQSCHTFYHYLHFSGKTELQYVEMFRNINYSIRLGQTLKITTINLFTPYPEHSFGVEPDFQTIILVLHHLLNINPKNAADKLKTILTFL